MSMMMARAVGLCAQKAGRRGEVYYWHGKRWLPVMVIKYGLICGGVIWVAFFLIVVSLGLESPSALAAALILELGLGAP